MLESLSTYFTETPTVELIWIGIGLVAQLMFSAYAVYRMDPVFIMGQSFGVIVYSRNLYLLHKGKHPESSAS